MHLNPPLRALMKDECIYKVFEPISETIPPRPHHTSKFAQRVRYEWGTGIRRHKHRTMGVADEKETMRQPTKYLKRGEGFISSQAPRPPHKHRCFKPELPHPPKYTPPPKKAKDDKEKDKAEKKAAEQALMQTTAASGPMPCYSGVNFPTDGPSIPVAGPSSRQIAEANAAAGLTTTPEAGTGTGKKKKVKSEVDKDMEKYDFNFRLNNIKTVMSLTPKQPAPRIADTRHGDTYLLPGSGLFPAYVYSKRYGKVPKYIIRRSEEMALAKQMADLRENRQPKCRYITQHERLALLEGLKSNWEDVTAAYNKQSVLIDSASKVQRKARLENELKCLERDIKKLDAHPYIYVRNDVYQTVGGHHLASRRGY